VPSFGRHFSIPEPAVGLVSCAVAGALYPVLVWKRLTMFFICSYHEKAFHYKNDVDLVA
jgi:hypothetical protein